jgi:hypothetical protein
MTVMLPPEVEKKLIALAARKSVDPASLVASLVEKELNKEELALVPVADAGQDNDFVPNALNRAIAAIVNRTPERIKAAQDMALKVFRAERELPEDAKSIFDVIPVIKGNETDEPALKD